MPAVARPRRNPYRLVGLVLAAGLAAGASTARGAERTGVVLMHGEQGAPGRVIDNLAQALENGGYLVGRPDMCWSARRGYEQPFEDCLAAVDGAIVKLKNLGATTVAVAGFSLGGTAAIAYGARRPGLLGVIAIAPAHDASVARESAAITDSVALAQRLVDAGKGDDPADFADVVFGPAGAYPTEIATTPSIYLTFFGAASPTMIPANIGRLGAPLLWLAGTSDPTQGVRSEALFAQATSNALNRYVEVAGGHRDTPDQSMDAVLTWLRAVGAATP